MRYVLEQRPALMACAAVWAESDGLLEVRDVADPGEAGLRLTQAGQMLAIALGYDPTTEQAVSAVVLQTLQEVEPTARELVDKLRELGDLREEVAGLRRQARALGVPRSVLRRAAQVD